MSSNSRTDKTFESSAVPVSTSLYPTNGTMKDKVGAWLRAYQHRLYDNVESHEAVMKALDNKAFEYGRSLVAETQKASGIPVTADYDAMQLKTFQAKTSGLVEMMTIPSEDQANATTRRHYQKIHFQPGDYSREDFIHTSENFERYIPNNAFKEASNLCYWRVINGLSSCTQPEVSKEDAANMTAQTSIALDAWEATWVWCVEKDGGAAKNALVERWNTILKRQGDVEGDIASTA